MNFSESGHGDPAVYKTLLSLTRTVKTTEIKELVNENLKCPERLFYPFTLSIIRTCKADRMAMGLIKDFIVDSYFHVMPGPKVSEVQ